MNSFFILFYQKYIIIKIINILKKYNLYIKWRLEIWTLINNFIRNNIFRVKWVKLIFLFYFLYIVTIFNWVLYYIIINNCLLLFLYVFKKSIIFYIFIIVFINFIFFFLLSLFYFFKTFSIFYSIILRIP